jgi:SAM-dependent methyltransferase
MSVGAWPGPEPPSLDRRCRACDRDGCVPRYRLAHGAILECSACGSALTDYAQADGGERAMGQWYADRQFLRNRIYALPFSRAQAWRRVLRLRRHLESGRVLELGSGDGAFAYACAQAGFETIACDRFLAPLPENRAAGVLAVRADATRLPFRGSVDAAAAFHLLGHLKDPAAVLRQLRERLRAHGIVYLETPNYGSLWRRLRGARWANLYDVWESHLSAPGLERLLSRCGFRVRESWTHETAVELLGGHYYSLRNRVWSAAKRLLGGADGPGEVPGPAGVARPKRALYRFESALPLRLFCLPGAPLAWLDSRLGVASFASAIAERSDT